VPGNGWRLLSTMAGHDAHGDEPYPAIPQACDILTAFVYCKKQAEAYHRCAARCANSAAVARSCAFESASFVSCGEETLPKVIEALVAIAAKRCLTEVGAHEKCLRKHSGYYHDECARTDALALNCAARHVVAESKQGK
jgi:hypothetical protein